METTAPAKRELKDLVSSYVNAIKEIGNVKDFSVSGVTTSNMFGENNPFVLIAEVFQNRSTNLDLARSSAVAAIDKIAKFADEFGSEISDVGNIIISNELSRGSSLVITAVEHILEEFLRETLIGIGLSLNIAASFATLVEGLNFEREINTDGLMYWLKDWLEDAKKGCIGISAEGWLDDEKRECIRTPAVSLRTS